MFTRYFRVVIIAPLAVIMGLAACDGNTAPHSIVELGSSSASPPSSTPPLKIEEEEHHNLNQKIRFTDGAGHTEPTTLQVGDTFLGWELATYQVLREEYMKALFKGTVQVKGRLAISPKEEYSPNQLQFYVTDEAYAKLLPRLIDDNRDIMFLLKDAENTRSIFEALQSMNPNPDDFFGIEDCEIVIKDYLYFFYPAEVTDSAELVKTINIPGIDAL